MADDGAPRWRCHVGETAPVARVEALAGDWRCSGQRRGHGREEGVAVTTLLTDLVPRREKNAGGED